ncbi:MAG: hypothetical protein AAFX39_14845 [Pseudomonadota bacterium]
MIKKLTLAAAALALGLNTAQANDDTFGYQSLTGDEVAASACLVINEYQPTEIVAMAEDGMGDYIVWLSDRDGDLWACNANAQGDIYTYDLIVGDLFEGEGVAMLMDAGYQQINLAAQTSPQEVANTICALPLGNEGEIIASVPDGMGDYLVWLIDGSEQLWMCNASARAEVYTYTPVDVPLLTVEGLSEA